MEVGYNGFYVTVYIPHFHYDYYGQEDVIFEIHIKRKLAGKYEGVSESSKTGPID
jgi:hypothetical protein